MKKSVIFLLSGAVLLASCNSGNRDFYDDENQNGAPYDERSAEFMTQNNEFAQIDSFQPKSMREREAMSKKWDTARKETRWQEYKGTMVRVEILLGDTDIREMRLRLIPNADGMDVDADARGVLGHVADYEMKRVCGRNADGVVTIYDQPSFQVMRPTSFFDYRVESEGVTMREYGFRCVYNK